MLWRYNYHDVFAKFLIRIACRRLCVGRGKDDWGGVVLVCSRAEVHSSRPRGAYSRTSGPGISGCKYSNIYYISEPNFICDNSLRATLYIYMCVCGEH